MSDKSLIRRAKATIVFAGTDISADVARYLQTLTYTDNESEEADDLQIKLDDREGLWLTKWLNTAIQAAAAKLPQQVAGSSGPSDGSWAVGQAVVANGRPQISSYGGSPGATVTNHHGNITYLNIGAPYPIHIDHLGWFATSQITGNTPAADGGGSDSSIKGMHIECVIVRENWNGDGKDLALDCGAFELDSVSASGPPSVVTIKATSLPFKSSMRNTKKSRAWENYKLSGIAKEIGSKNGMSVLCDFENDPLIVRAEQINQSDIAFLQAQCSKYGVSLKSTGSILVLFDQSQYEAKTSTRTIKRGEAGGYEKYKVGTGAADTQYGACHVQYTDPKTKAVIEYTYKVPDADSDAPTLEIRQKVNSVAEAKALAEKMARLKNKYEYSAEFTFPGDPMLVAGVTVKLEDFGDFSGKYIISQAKHSLGTSGYKTTIKLRKVLEGY